ncbi:unnamed protein product, partial [Closterium sp. Naga37s-1]
VCVGAGDMARAEHLVRLAQAAGGAAAPNCRVLTVMARGYCQAGQRRQAYALLQEMERRGPAPDAAVYHVVMEGERHAEAVTALLAAMARCHVPPTERTFSVAMACMGRAGDVAAAEALWRHMTAAHIPPSPFAFCALAHVYGQAGMVERCAAMVQQMERSLGHKGRWQARRTARRAESAALRDSPDWSPLAGAQGADRGEGGMMGAGEEMGEVGGMAGGAESGGDDGVGRGSGDEGIKRRGRGRRLHAAGVGEERDSGGGGGQYSERMATARGGTQATNRTLLTSAHNILIGAHAGRGDAEAAVAVLRGMRRRGLHPCMRSFNAAAHACMRARQVERAVRLLGEAQRRGLPPTAATFALLIQAAGHMRRAGMVEAALHRMALAGCPHDAVTYRSAVYAWVRCGEGGRALEVLQEMVAAGHPPAMTVPDVLIKSVDGALLLECTRAAPDGNLKNFLREMRSAGLTPTASTSAHLVQLLASSHSPAQALDAAHELAAAGVGQLGDATWHAIGQAVWHMSHRKPHEAALAAQRLLPAVEADGCPVTRELYEVAIAVHVRSGHGTTALHLHRLMDAAHPAAPAAHPAAPAAHPAAHATQPAAHATQPAREDGTRPAPQGGLQEASRGAARAAQGDATPPAAQGEATPPTQRGWEETGEALEEALLLEGVGDGQGRGEAWSGVAGRVADGHSIDGSTAPMHCVEPSPRSSSDNDSIYTSEGDMSSREGGMSSSEEASSELTFLEAIDAALTHALAEDIARASSAAPPHAACTSTGSSMDGGVGRGVAHGGHGSGRCDRVERERGAGEGSECREVGRMDGQAGGSSRWEEGVAERVANQADAGGVSGLVADLAASGIRVKPRAVQSAIRQLLLHDDCHAALTAAAAPPARPTHPASPTATAIAIRRPAASSEAAGRVGEVERAEASEEEVGSGGGGSDAEAVPWLERAISLVDALPRLFAQQPTAYVYAELLRACVRKRQWRRGEQLWQQMGAAGVQADVPCWLARLRCLGALSRIAGASHALVAEAAAAGTAMERHPDLLRCAAPATSAPCSLAAPPVTMASCPSTCPFPFAIHQVPPPPPLSLSLQQCTAEGVPAGQ